MNLDELIKNRRSVRKFKDKPVDDEKINVILEAGRWAPSGLNNQPWRFYALKDRTVKEKLADFTKYSRIIKNSGACICVFLDGDAGYDRTKDSMAIGACIQNMLLTAEDLGLAACWLGEILNRKSEVNEFLNVNSKYELMAVIALGYGDENPSSDRKPLTNLVIKN
ncbi:MAG: nitroreductase family protein [Candidatus Altiarchaeum hamiconexum]|uniref:Nitroreductase family protein n=1 Tax=Candidatus Altarchaeum hamiconexum TaxID=1803513 RepID=A0A8J7YX66_9ARCH|nr:nitroreductase family protein [Candidatus Altarchaeum hamiconexum]NCN68326.1 nitroreductase family protein [Candidatus Altarchaeum hamiconexum]NCS91879.1 nitroreductase family protein [Candidatus Altarchaeum hamiconexum]